METKKYEGEYNSTYGFVQQNGLEQKATEIFGANWEAEDDVAQIERLLSALGEKFYDIEVLERAEDDLKITFNEQSAELYKWAKKFPNGFNDWQETHFEMVSAITLELESIEPKGAVKLRHGAKGLGGLYTLAKELTDKFEAMHEGKEWGIDDDTQYYDAISEFLEKNLY